MQYLTFSCKIDIISEIPPETPYGPSPKKAVKRKNEDEKQKKGWPKYPVKTFLSEASNILTREAKGKHFTGTFKLIYT